MTVTLSPLTAADVRPLARLHREAFPGYFLSELGESFLVQLYRGFLTDESAVTVVARTAEGALQGAVVGTTEPAGFFKRLLVRRWHGFVLASAKAVVTNPSATPRLLRAIVYRGDMPSDAKGALLSSLCVTPSRQGAGVGRQLVAAWMAEAADRGAREAFLTTDAEDNDGVNRFYQARGWVLTDTFATRQGRLMNRYTTRLDRQ